MKKQVYKIDENGYMQFGKEKNVLIDEVVPGYIDVSLPLDDEGNQLPFYRPKWNGVEWIEGMTPEEIDELNNQPKEPTKEELIEQELANTNALILELTELIMGGM